MAYRKGANVLIMKLDSGGTAGTWSDYTPIAGQQNATFNRASDNFSYNVKGDSWTYNEATYRNWSIDCDGLYVIDDTVFDALQDDFLAGNDIVVAISFELEEGDTPVSGDTFYYGTGIISDFSVECPQDNMVSYSISILGKGELTEVTTA